MRLLVLGGTAWLGSHLVRCAIERGHEVTCVARGESGAAPAGATLIRADRDRADALDAVAGMQWDAVLDVARQPGQVRRAVRALEPVAERMLFVSSVSAYADQSAPVGDEDAPLLPALEDDVMATMEQYGRAKAACEQAVVGAFGPDRSLIVRAGLIGGPGDWSGRSGYWPWRFARAAASGAPVVVPDAGDQATQLVDVRDLAAWAVLAVEQGTHGAMNAVGDVMTLERFLAVAREVAEHRGPILRAEPSWLQAHGVDEWMGPTTLPMWLADPGWQGMQARRNDRAVAAGLVLRPLRDTLADVLAWERATHPDDPHGAGLTDGEERALAAQLGR